MLCYAMLCYAIRNIPADISCEKIMLRIRNLIAKFMKQE